MIGTRLTAAAAFLCLSWLATVASAQTVFVVRHAERADTNSGAPTMMATDPSLSAAGHTRAASLAAMLRDAQISAIFVTEYKRTQETAAPLANALGIKPMQLAANDMPGLIAHLKAAKGNVLVVGHSNTVPDIVKGLGVTSPVAVADTEFDKLFVVTMQPPRVVQLRYR